MKDIFLTASLITSAFNSEKNIYKISVRKFSHEGLEQVAQGSYWCIILKSVQGQVGWSSEWPGLVGGVPVRSTKLELNEPFLPKTFYDKEEEEGRFFVLVVFLQAWKWGHGSLFFFSSLKLY